jgi:hypothetical protein
MSTITVGAIQNVVLSASHRQLGSFLPRRWGMASLLNSDMLAVSRSPTRLPGTPLVLRA